jgi:pre-mRNA-splicing helicase BRR2
MVENTLKDLAEAKIVDVDEEDDTVTPLNAAMIAAYYNISFITMQTFLLSLTGKTKLKGILEIVTSATEFESIQIRRHEDRVLRRIYDSVPVKMSQPNYESPHFKAFVLLQAHFSRMQLPADLTTDQAVVLGKILNLLSACVDVLSSEGHLNAMSAMEMSQMCVQAMWDRDSALMQIPFFTPERVKAAGELGIKTIFDFMDAMGEDSTRTRLLQRTSITESQLGKIAHFTNKKYPNIDLAYELEDPDSVVAGSPSYIKVKIERELDGEDEKAEVDTTVHAPFYPQNKIENWWIVVGEESSKALLAIKRVTIGRRLDVRLDYTVPNPGRHELKLFLMSDSYVGVDLEEDFEVEAAEGMDEDGDEEDDDE